jgi:molecular chaperone GrpE (heat shock protein)
VNSPNPPLKSIDIDTNEGLELLKTKAKYYGHYAENLKVLELIAEIERLRANTDEEVEKAIQEASNKLGW